MTILKLLLNGTPIENNVDIPEGNDLDVNDGPIDKAEFINSVKKLQDNKTPGAFGIPPEALKTDLL